MNLKEVIEHAKEVSEKKYLEAMLCHANPDDGNLDECIECAREHEQLAEWLQELNEYKQLGTIEELREALEKRIPKKPNMSLDTSWGIKREVNVCPMCDYFLSEINFIGDGEKVSYCEVCGQAIDWEETE